MIASGQKEPHLHINLPDLTGLEDKYQNILRHISDIHNRKASTEEVRSLCDKVQRYIHDNVANTLLGEFAKLQETVVEFNGRMEDKVLMNGHLRILCTVMALVIAAGIILFIRTPPMSRDYKRDAEKYRIMRSMNRETDTIYYHLDRLYNSNDRKAIRIQQDSLAARNARRNQKSYKTK